MDMAIGELNCQKTHYVSLLGVYVHSITLDGIFDRIITSIVRDGHILITYVNIYALNLAYELPWLRSFVNHCEVVFCDGYGVKLGAKIIGEDRLHRYTPPDWIPQLCDICAREGFSMFLLGTRPGVAEKAAEQLVEKHPGLCIAGTHHGYFDKAQGSAENRAVVEKIRQAKPNILLVGFGMPTQERWLMENWDRIDANVALPVGAAIDYLAGEVPRAPRWMTDHGLEWLGRLAIEPSRLWKRYLFGNPLFFYRVFLQRIGRLKLKE